MCLPMSPFLIHHAYFLNRFKICKSIATHTFTTHLRLLVCITNNQSALLFTLLWPLIGYWSSKIHQSSTETILLLSIQKQMALNKCSTTNWLVKNLLRHFAIPEMILVDQSNKNLLLSHVRCQRIRTSR